MHAEGCHQAVAETVLTCVVKDDQSLRATFEGEAPAGAAAATTGEDEKARRLRWLWIASNTSLILPCLLALAVLYIASQNVSHFESEASARTSHIEAREAELVKAYQARERDLHSALLEAIKSASAKATEHTCCCPLVPQPKNQAPKQKACLKPGESASGAKS